MNIKYSITALAVTATLLIASCTKESFSVKDQTPLKVLNQKEIETVQKFKHASLVLQGLFSTNPAIRKEFQHFIAAKLERSGTDEELTFKEIFEGRPINLKGVKTDFLSRFRDQFIDIMINGKYPESKNFPTFSTSRDVASYFDVSITPTLNNNSSTNDESIPYEIYFPYSENWNPEAAVNYAITHHPLSNVEWNYGMFFDANGNPLYEVTVDDDYAYNNPTFIITYDDGLKIEDFNGGNLPIESPIYRIGLTDNDYYPIVLQNTPITPNPSPCLSELRVKDGRWTLLRNGYGIFEGRIEFAVAVTINVSEVTIPNQSPQSNPIILTNKSGHAWGYEKFRRKKVRKMIENENEFISFGLKVSPWCSNQPDKMLFLYEYDKPNFLSTNAKEWANLLTAGVGLVGDSATRASLSSLASAGVAPLVKNLLEGTADSKIEHYSIIGSNAVNANQKLPSNASRPPLLNGYRPYGTNNVLVTLVVEQ